MPKLHGLRYFIKRRARVPACLNDRDGRSTYRNISAVILVFSVFFLSGCATVPFAPVAQTSMTAASAETVRTQFSLTQDSDYEALQSVVFQLFGRKMTGLGYFSVDTKTSTFALSCMTPMGMKLFDIQGQGDAVEAVFALPQFGKKENLARAVGLDLKRTYFDSIPSENAEIRREKHRLVFIERRADGRTEYDFGGPEQLLLEKRVYEGRKMVCRVRYYEYEPQNGFLYPHGIILENRNYHYRLILRLKSVYPAPIK